MGLSRKRPAERKCSECKQMYLPRNSGQKACSLPCALSRSERQNRERQEKAIRRRQREEALDLKRRKAALMTTRDHAKIAQRAFNRYIRARDWGKPCISCNQPAHIGARHASHYRSRAAAPQLAYNTLNVAASCAQCNSFKSGNINDYRIALVNKIGEERVQALEHENGPARFNAEYLKRIAYIFNKRARLYERRHSD